MEPSLPPELAALRSDEEAPPTVSWRPPDSGPAPKTNGTHSSTTNGTAPTEDEFWADEAPVEPKRKRRLFGRAR